MKVTIITMQGCAHCGKVLKALSELQSEFPEMKIEEIDITSDEGQKLIAEHGIMSSPGVLIEEKLAFFGPRSKEEIKKVLRTSS